MGAYSYKLHSEVSAEYLYSKWGIGLKNVKIALDVTTQMNAGLSILPLTIIYQDDLFLRNLVGWELSSILKLYLLVTLICKAINAPRYTLTGTDLYIYSWWGPRMGQVTHWVMWSRILVSWIKLSVTTLWIKSIWIQSSWESPVSITCLFIPLSHTHHGRTRPKIRSESSRVEHIGVRQGVRYWNVFRILGLYGNWRYNLTLTTQIDEPVWKDWLVTHRTYLIRPILNSMIWFGIGMAEMKIYPKNWYMNRGISCMW